MNNKGVITFGLIAGIFVVTVVGGAFVGKALRNKAIDKCNKEGGTECVSMVNNMTTNQKSLYLQK